MSHFPIAPSQLSFAPGCVGGGCHSLVFPPASPSARFLKVLNNQVMARAVGMGPGVRIILETLPPQLTAT